VSSNKGNDEMRGGKRERGKEGHEMRRDGKADGTIVDSDPKDTIEVLERERTKRTHLNTKERCHTRLAGRLLIYR
jgi:hypothetical protein